MIAYHNNPDELICVFTDALNEIDRNMERYMVEELNQQVNNLKDTVQSQEDMIQVLKQKLAQYDGKTKK